MDRQKFEDRINKQLSLHVTDEYMLHFNFMHNMLFTSKYADEYIQNAGEKEYIILEQTLLSALQTLSEKQHLSSFTSHKNYSPILAMSSVHDDFMKSDAMLVKFRAVNIRKTGSINICDLEYFSIMHDNYTFSGDFIFTEKYEYETVINKKSALKLFTDIIRNGFFPHLNMPIWNGMFSYDLSKLADVLYSANFSNLKQLSKFKNAL